MKNIYDYSLEQLTEYFASIKQKPFRAKQVFSWLYQKDARSFDDMSDLSKDLRNQLKVEFSLDVLKIKEKQVSRDGTIKYLFELLDGSLIESVLMIHDYGKSLCVTSQIGCNMKCTFCASGLLRKQRDLTPGEIVAQIIKVQQDIDQRVSHVVVMGTGEPFDNYDNVMEFVRIINHPHGLAIGARHITISTCGLIKGIKRYSEEGIQTNLAISLHAANDEILYARQLAHYLRGLNAYVNLIPYNSVDEHGYQPSDKETVEIFKNELLRLHINVTLRKEHGRDIDGACGQLRAKRSGVK